MAKRKKRKREKFKFSKRLYIVCEGQKTEKDYLENFIDDCNINHKLVDVQVLQTKKNTPKELVNFIKTKGDCNSDELWAVFDHDGHPNLGDAFNNAQKNNIRIAFSNIAFEYWILLHFEYTTRAFSKCRDIIRYLKEQNHFPDYEKNDRNLYERLKEKTATAESRAKRGRQAMKKANPGARVFEITPYTNVDELLEAIRNVGK
ncbi:MAG: RloB domain-containing protein [bacterium]|nr:RloB domain-containing protein [bacterium]